MTNTIHLLKYLLPDLEESTALALVQKRHAVVEILGFSSEEGNEIQIPGKYKKREVLPPKEVITKILVVGQHPEEPEEFSVPMTERVPSTKEEIIDFDAVDVSNISDEVTGCPSGAKHATFTRKHLTGNDWLNIKIELENRGINKSQHLSEREGNEIGKMFGFSDTTIRRVHKGRTKYDNENFKPWSEFDEQTKSVIRKYFNAGVKVCELAAKFNTPSSAISRIVGNTDHEHK